MESKGNETEETITHKNGIHMIFSKKPQNYTKSKRSVPIQYFAERTTSERKKEQQNPNPAHEREKKKRTPKIPTNPTMTRYLRQQFEFKQVWYCGKGVSRAKRFFVASLSNRRRTFT